MFVMLTDTLTDRYVTVFKTKAALKKSFINTVKTTVADINHYESKSWDVEEEAKTSWEQGWFDTYDLSTEACISITFVETTFGVAAVMTRE